jgi:glutamyl-tRNA reductase
MRVVLCGLNHKTAPVEVRESLSVPADDHERAITRLCKETGLREALLLVTCNRVELYGVPGESAPSRDRLVSALASLGGQPIEALDRYLYHREGTEAVGHLFEVASSLDSMIVGEPQILGQVKEAAGLAREAGTLGPILDRVVSRALSVAKRVRNETGIAKSVVSVGSVAVDLARRIFPDLGECRVLLIGAGKMGEVVARSLTSAGVSRVYVANRSPERARRLAEAHRWRARDFAELPELLAEVDVVLTSTGASHPILDAALLRPIVKQRKYRPLFIVDIAVPRDVSADVAELDSVYLYNIDDLLGLGLENLRLRELEAEAARGILAEELAHLDAWFRGLAVQPTVAAIRERAQRLAREELERTCQKRLSHLGADDRAALEKMLDAMLSKLLHPTMTALRAEPSEQLVAQAKLLHGLLPDAEAAPSGEAPAVEVDPAKTKEAGG